jgi:hypothetical protein
MENTEENSEKILKIRKKILEKKKNTEETQVE